MHLLARTAGVDDAEPLRLGLGKAAESGNDPGMICGIAPTDPVAIRAVTGRGAPRRFVGGQFEQDRAIGQKAFRAEPVQREDRLVPKPPATP